MLIVTIVTGLFKMWFLEEIQVTHMLKVFWSYAMKSEANGRCWEDIEKNP